MTPPFPPTAPVTLWEVSDGSEAADYILCVSDVVRYRHRGDGSFIGTVTAIDEAGRVEVQQDGEAPCWVAADRCRIVLTAQAAMGCEGVE